MSTSQGRITRANAAVWRTTDVPPFAMDPDLACRQPGVDPEWFFPTGTSIEQRVANTQARATCRRCPRRDECLAWALDTNQPHGTYGGKTRAQRDVIRRRSQ